MKINFNQFLHFTVHIASAYYINIVKFCPLAAYNAAEFAESGALYNYLRLHTIDFHQILLWAKQIAMGMNYLHYEAPVPVIHRDLKSKNGEYYNYW